MLIGDILMQVCDGIHGSTRFMRVKDGIVRQEHISVLKDRLQETVERMGRDEFLDMLEEKGASFSDMERVYGEYNSFARTEDSTEYFAWFDNDR